MNTIPLQWIIVAGAVVIALLALAAWFFSQKKKQSVRLQQRFGPEYGRAVGELGGRTKAESELKAREKRVEHLTITPLAPAEAARFSQAWNALQGRFVDNPKGVVATPWAISNAVRPISQSITPPSWRITGRRGRSRRAMSAAKPTPRSYAKQLCITASFSMKCLR
jgi:hypothetical protein